MEQQVLLEMFHLEAASKLALLQKIVLVEEHQKLQEWQLVLEQLEQDQLELEELELEELEHLQVSEHQPLEVLVLP